MSKKEFWINIATTLLAVAFVVFYIFYMYKTADDCSAKDGKLVRTNIGELICVKKDSIIEN